MKLMLHIQYLVTSSVSADNPLTINLAQIFLHAHLTGTNTGKLTIVGSRQ